ncbi:hypothetical protein MBAV_003154 [Candidatus Magnetobacterium bavaricum]|uniref:Uncharacterized protein n=1 Tax=Candidatus Magnetobacterium bavaricum TaxID=29290 RepID=A0A0F3GRX0_9BACT|nr:hypothetical protein MBAV_003154 [Candidatus Magnetobacterium bavaricum]
MVKWGQGDFFVAGAGATFSQRHLPTPCCDKIAARHCTCDAYRHLVAPGNFFLWNKLLITVCIGCLTLMSVGIIQSA